nr:zincin-like metallopeptidase domain-containing protein [uncultured Prevotella sp.]
MSPKKNTHEATFSETVIPEELQSNILVDFNSISFPFPNHNVREKLKGSAITSRNIDNLGIGSVNLYGGNTVSYREVKKDVDLSDFYEATSVEFTKLSSDKSVFSFWEGLKSDKDLKWHHSPLSNSEYLVNHHTGDIYRFSDHWGKVASCEWSLNDDSTEGWSVGVANIQSFKSLPFSRSLVLKGSFVNQLNQVIANLHDIIDSTDIKKTDSALRTLNKRLDDLKSHKASLKDWKVYIENANLIKSKDIPDMAYKKTNASSSASSSYSDAVIQQFADMMIKRMEDMKESNWKKGWMDGRGDAGFPRNALTGRQYNGINPFMLMYDTIKHEYTTSMYLTARQLFSMNESLKDPSTGKIASENLDKVMKINKGEKAFPVYYMIHKYKDMQGKEYSDQEYNDLSEEQRKDIKAYFYPKVHHLFNIDQTNMKEVNPSLYNSFVDKYTKRPSLPDSEGMYINEDIDSLLAHSKPSVWKSGKDNLSWYCPIEQTDNISSPHYNLSKDFIKVPLKNQYKTSNSKEGIFADGQAFYATLLHEMAHSTGPKGRLNRDMNGSFGDKKYAKEELVAELSAALISSTMGFDKRINDNNAKYVSSWLKVLKEEPSFIKTVLSDVGKASDMINEKIDEQRVDLNQTLLRGSNLKGQDNELSNSSRPERTENEMSLNELIDYQVETDTGNRTKADTNHYDDKRLYLPLLVDGKTSHLAVETVVPDAITAPSYQRTVYNFGDEVEAKVDNVWQKWEDISNEYNLSVEDADRSVVDSDAPSLIFRSVDSAVKFADWITAKYAKTEQKSESTELIYSNGKQQWTSFDSLLKAAKEHQITRSEFMALSTFNTVKGSHPHNLTQSAIEYLQQQHKHFSPEAPIVPGSPLYDAIKMLKEGKVFAEYRGNREVDLSSSIKDDEMLSAEEIEKLKAMASDASDGKSKSTNIDNKPLIEKVPYGEFYLPDWSIPYFKDGKEEGLSAEQLKTIKDFEKDFPSKLSIEITESSIEGNHNTELGPATTVVKAKIYYFEQHISDLFPTDESTRDRLDKDLSEDNKNRKTLSDLQAQYSNINAQYPAAVNDERTRQIAKRIRQAEQIITAYNANVEAVYGESFMFSPESQTVLIPQTIYSGRERPVLDKTNATPIDESLSTKSETGILSSEGMPKVDLQSQWGNIKKQINSIVQKERQGVNFDFTKDISLARDYIANNFQVSGEIFDSFSDSDKERLVSLYSNYSSSLLSSFTEERKVEREISDFILLGGLLDPENSQKVLAKGHEKMNLLRETPNVNLAVLKSSVLSLTDNQHRESNSIAYGQYDIPIWAVKHLSEGKDSSLSEAKLSEIESFKSQLPNNSFFEFKESNVSYSEKPAFGPATNVIKAHIYVSRDQHQEESVSINKSVNDSEEYTMARRLPQQDSKKNEEIFYSSVVSIKSGEDLQLFDSMREKGHLNKLLKVAAEYDSGDAISLDTTHKSPLQNSGDEVLRENKNYAVVYNNSAGGAYEIFRKSPQSEILNSVERYGLPSTASEDVKSLSGRKDYSSDHDLYEATQHEDHDALKFAAASRGMTPKQMEESLAAGTEERLPDSSELDKKRGLDDREKEIELKNEELSGEVSSKLELQDKNVEARRKEESQREAEKKEKEKQESQKKDDSSAKIITAAFLRSSLLSTALLSAKDNNRVWLNAGGKKSPTFHQASWDVSPYNQIFMSLNSDKNGYATNVYTTFKHEDSLAVKKGSESLPYSWTDWSMYKSKGPEPKSITSNQYENLSPDEKEHFMKAPVKYDRKIFNIDQTVLKGANPEQYNAVLKEHDTHYKEMQTIASTDSVDLVSDRVSKIKKQHPDHLVLFAHNGVYNAFGKDAKTIHQLAKDSVTLDSINNSKSNRKTSIAYLKPSDLDKVLKAVVSSGQRVAVADNFEVLNAPKEATKILSKAESVLDNYSKSTGINVQKSLTQPTSYDKETDTIILNNKKPVNPGSELRTAVENSNAIYFAISQSVANNKRLDISNQFSMPEKDIESVKQLIATVSAGVLSLKQAHPAVLSDQVSNESVESWVQDIKNDPHLLSSLERNVNNTVKTIEKLVKGEQVDYASINGKSSYNKAESFNLVSELNEVVNTSTMSAAVIRNNDGKSASVILSKGIESISENGVLNNEAFRQALLKQGVKEVKFFNPGGTLGLNKGDSYFEDKSIQIVNFDGKEVVPQQELHLNKQSQNVEHNFEDVSAVKDDNNRWHLYIKEKDQPYFIIQPEMRDMSRLFEAFKSQDQQAIYDTKTSLGEKYTKIVQQRPELKVDFLMPKVPAEDITRIERANIARDAQDKNKYLIFATIDGKGYHHEISREDFRRMWKVDNMQSYKSALAAKVFSNVLHEGQTVSEAPSVEENQQVKETNSEKVDSPKQSTESEESLSPRVGRFH